MPGKGPEILLFETSLFDIYWFGKKKKEKKKATMKKGKVNKLIRLLGSEGRFPDSLLFETTLFDIYWFGKKKEEPQ